MASPPCKQRRLDGKVSNGQLPKSPLLLSYCGSCQCGAVAYDIETPTSIDANATVYRCECSGCFKRGYKFFVVSMKQFKFTSRCASDLGTFASEAGMSSVDSWLTLGLFLHCFCRHCGTPLWVECNDIAIDCPVVAKFREVAGPGATTIGVNLRTFDLPHDVLEEVKLERFYPKNDECFLDIVTSPSPSMKRALNLV